jgi:hypothetical protein
MQTKMAKVKEETTEEQKHDHCFDPQVGEQRIVAYITNDMTDAERREFVAHVANCKHCLQETVLWRTAEALVDIEDRPEQELTPSA